MVENNMKKAKEQLKRGEEILRTCSRCGGKIEKDLKPIISISAECRVYSPNRLCRECRPFSKRG